MIKTATDAEKIRHYFLKFRQYEDVQLLQLHHSQDALESYLKGFSINPNFQCVCVSRPTLSPQCVTFILVFSESHVSAFKYRLVLCVKVLSVVRKSRA